MSATSDQPLVDRLASAIQSRVLSGQIPSGSRLRQETLANEFGVSRTPVREALRKLQSGGLVHVEPNRGAIVHGPTAREIREAYEVRAELEGLAAELAPARISDEQLARLREAERLFRRSMGSLIHRRRKGESSDWTAESEWEQANNVFHQVIQEAAGNERLLAIIATLHLSFPRALSWTALSESSHLLEENIEQHHRILEAIERRDQHEARRLMVEHVHSAGELVTLHLEQVSARQPAIES